MDFSLIFYQLFNGLTIGLIYTLLAIGLSIVFGIMNVINFAHGAIYALGAYFAFTISSMMGSLAGSFWVAIIAAPICVGLVGVLIEVVFIRKMYDEEHSYQILLTYGIMLVIQELIIIIWTAKGQSVPIPKSLSAVIHIGIFTFPAYRIFLVIFISAICLVLWLVLEKTNLGAVVRAGEENRDMTSCLGINIHLLFTIVFGVGLALAGLAGALVTPMRGAQPFMGESILTLCFVVVVIGGLGSFSGAVVGGLVVGIIEALMALIWPPGTMIAIFIALAIVILVRPQGLLGKR